MRSSIVGQIGGHASPRTATAHSSIGYGVLALVKRGHRKRQHGTVLAVPLQVWLSQVSENLELGPVRRDAKRAFDAWRGESTIWLMRGLHREVRWQEGHLARMLAIPAERMDRIDIFHVGKNGYVWGPGSEDRFPRGRIDRLLSIWLAIRKDIVQFALLPEEVSIRVPEFSNDKMVGYRDTMLRLRPLGAYHIEVIDPTERIVQMSWPLKGMPKPVSPDAESADLYGPLSVNKIEGVPIASSTSSPELRSLPHVLLWPQVISDLMPRGSGLDELLAQQRMVNLAERSNADLQSALDEAREASSSYLTERRSIRELTELWPTFAEAGENEALFKMQHDLGVDASSLEQLFRMPKARTFLQEEVPVRRAWGARGLFWSLLLDRLGSGGHFVRCELCNRMIPATGPGKRFCRREDSEECFLRRTADYKRTARRKR
jgi:hypothetical protein